ncbi:MAG: molybdate ABC transporter substrate-binding protein [Gammaproteobacteria bacterium]|nr:molybdate ABC transporter substrate-binding protein [Gammaproteobacteria bacterium]
MSILSFRYVITLFPVLAGVIIGILIWPSATWATNARIAVASNFAPVIKELAAQFEQQSGYQLTLAFGSTGKHFTQIQHGAPFDAFFAADALRPKLLEQAKRIQKGSRFTYAIGRLVLWSQDKNLVPANGGMPDLSGIKHIAMANPRLAPYGLAARQTLEHMSLYETLKTRLVFGENINQTYQFIASGNAQLGFVAYSQLQVQSQQSEKNVIGSYWLIPSAYHQPIEQQAVLINKNIAAEKFMAYVRSNKGKTIIRQFGYNLPE